MVPSACPLASPALYLQCLQGSPMASQSTCCLRPVLPHNTPLLPPAVQPLQALTPTPHLLINKPHVCASLAESPPQVHTLLNRGWQWCPQQDAHLWSPPPRADPAPASQALPSPIVTLATLYYELLTPNSLLVYGRRLSPVCSGHSVFVELNQNHERRGQGRSCC